MSAGGICHPDPVAKDWADLAELLGPGAFADMFKHIPSRGPSGREFDTARGFGAHVTTNDAARRSLWLNIFDEVSSEPGLLAGVAPVIDDLHGLTDAARSALRESLAQDEEVVEFVRFHVEEIENLEEDLGAKLNALLSGDGRPDLVANSFQVDSLVFRKDADGAPAFWLDFALAPEFSDEVLCVEFDHSRTVTRVSWES